MMNFECTFIRSFKYRRYYIATVNHTIGMFISCFTGGSDVLLKARGWETCGGAIAGEQYDAGDGEEVACLDCPGACGTYLRRLWVWMVWRRLAGWTTRELDGPQESTTVRSIILFLSCSFYSGDTHALTAHFLHAGRHPTVTNLGAHSTQTYPQYCMHVTRSDGIRGDHNQKYS